MKFKNILLLIINLTIIQIILSLKSRSKNRSKSRAKNKERVKNSNMKKNGPLSWDLLYNDDGLKTLLKSERQENYKSYKLNPSDNDSKINKFPFISNHQSNNYNPNFISKNELISENQISKTFRSVGPYDDSTINSNGIKYSNIYHDRSNKNLKAGFYGRSRLTRF